VNDAELRVEEEGLVLPVAVGEADNVGRHIIKSTFSHDLESFSEATHVYSSLDSPEISQRLPIRPITVGTAVRRPLAVGRVLTNVRQTAE
jgi:hypothetical protein